MPDFGRTLRKLETYPEWSELQLNTNPTKISRNGLGYDGYLFKEARHMLSNCLFTKDYAELSEEDQETAIAVVMWYYFICFYILGNMVELGGGRGVHLKVLGDKYKIKPFNDKNMIRVDSIMNNNSAFNFHNTLFAIKLKPYQRNGIIFLGIYPIDKKESLLQYAINYAKNYDTLKYVDLSGISGTAIICPDARDTSKSRGYGYSSDMNPVYWNFNSLYEFKFSELEKHFK